MTLATRIAATPTDKTLTPAERALFKRTEDQLRGDFAAVNHALKTHGYRFYEGLAVIANGRLYREEYATFGDYLGDRWGISAKYGYRLKAFVDLGTKIEAAGLPAPTVESQVRPLHGLPDETKLEVWREASAEAGGGVPVARQVQAAREKVAPKADPVERARAAGIIPEGVEVEVLRPVSPIGDTPAPEPDAGPTDAEWLDSLPARSQLAERIRPRFDVEALTHRKAKKARDAYRDAVRAILRAESKGLPVHIGPWQALHNSHFTRIQDPSDWKACADCGGQGIHAMLREVCPTCRGEGYHVK